MTDDLSLWGLFLSSFVSSTLFPGGSEVVLGWLAAQAEHSPWVLLVVVSTGNTLGGMTSWVLGYLVTRQGFAFAKRLLERKKRAVQWLRQRGNPLLLLSWVPVVGDPLCFAAGFLRLPFWPSLHYIAVGKTLRYGLILLVMV